MSTIPRLRDGAAGPKVLDRSAPLRPGQVLKEEFFDVTPDLRQGFAAWRMGISRTTLNQLLNNEDKAVTVEMALRLERFFPGTRAESWLYAQSDYDVHRFRSSARAMRQILKVQPWEGASADESVAAAEDRSASEPLRFPRERAAERIRHRLATTRRVPALTLRRAHATAP